MANIRELKKEDIKRVVELETLYLNETLGEDILQEELTSNITKFYVIEEDSKVIGYIGRYAYLGEAEVLNFVIDKAYQRKGYGQMLFDHMINEIDNLQKITLEVRANNECGKSFYKKNGFNTVSIRKSYYKNGDDALLMIKEIR